MIGMTSRKFPGVRNTSYYSVQVVLVSEGRVEYRKSSKTTKYALRAVACVSAYIGDYSTVVLSIKVIDWGFLMCLACACGD